MSLPAISIFSGCGGLDIGAESAGADVRVTVEWDAKACESLRLNFPETPVLERDITELQTTEILNEASLAVGEAAIMIGGPPCTPFSKSGYWLDYKYEGRDPDASLLQDYTRILAEAQPKAFLLENVYGLAYRNRKPILGRVLDEIEEAGYVHNVDRDNPAAAILNAADHGIPQLRQRLFIIGVRSDLKADKITLPAPTHAGPHERREVFDSALKPHVTTRDVLGDFEARDDLAEPGEQVNGKWGRYLPDIPPGQNYLYYTDRGGGKSLFEWRSRYWTFLLKLDPERPSSTLQANPGPYVGPFHWENRRLRIPEIKRLMGFPDDYKLAGDRRSIQRQLGNAVPPPLASRVLAHLVAQVQGLEEQHSRA